MNKIKNRKERCFRSDFNWSHELLLPSFFTMMMTPFFDITNEEWQRRKWFATNNCERKRLQPREKLIINSWLLARSNGEEIFEVHSAMLTVGLPLREDSMPWSSQDNLHLPYLNQQVSVRYQQFPRQNVTLSQLLVVCAVWHTNQWFLEAFQTFQCAWSF